MERALRRRLIQLALATIVVVTLSWLLWPATQPATGLAYAPPESGLENSVQVLNGTDRRRLALAAARFLRSRGIDVVDIGNGDPRDSTVALVRRGTSSLAERIVGQLGVGRVEEAPDSQSLVAVTLILGADYQPPVGPIP